MSLKFSTGLKNQLWDAISNKVSINSVLNGGVGLVYSGAQPATADAAVGGTLLGTISNLHLTFSAGAYQTTDADSICLTQTPVAVGNLTLNGANVNTGVATLPVGSQVTIACTGDSSAVVIRVTGTDQDGVAQVEYLTGGNNTTVSTARWWTTVTAVWFSAAAAGAVTVGHGITNGLIWAAAANGRIVKHADQIWQMAGIAVGTMGYVRFIGRAADAGATSTTLPRIDARIATTGAELNIPNLSVTVGAITTFDSVTLRWPDTL